MIYFIPYTSNPFELYFYAEMLIAKELKRQLDRERCGLWFWSC